MDAATPIGVTNFRNSNQPFGIKSQDRFGHIYAIGKTGVGKSTLLLNMAIADLESGNGFCIIDPHGDISKEILRYVPEHRIQDVVYFNPASKDFCIPFNPLQRIHPNFHHLVASGIVATFKKIWVDSWGPRMEHILRFSLLTLLNYPDATLLDIQPLLTDADFREHVLLYVEEQHIRSFWLLEFQKFSPQMKAEVIAPILNKVGLLHASKPLRNVVGQKTRGFRMQDVMDGRKILIANLAKGELGEDASSLLGSILVTSIQLAALHRARQEESKRVPFYLYIDETQSFVTLSFADILAEARKYRLSLFLTHQYVEQLDESIRHAIMGNVGTLITFRVGAEDAAYLKKEFAPTFTEEDLVNLPKYGMYLKLMIDGATSRPFSAFTLPKKTLEIDNSQKVLRYCKERYQGIIKQVVDSSPTNGDKQNLNLFT